MKQNRSVQLLSRGLAVILAFGLVLNLVWPDKGFSAVENRALQGFPAPNIQSVYDGTFQTRVTNWFSDQFVGRTSLFHLNYLVRKLAGQREINGVFLGHGALLAQSEDPRPDVWQNNIDALQAFSDAAGLQTTVMVVPNAANVQQKKLPWNAPVLSQQDILNQIAARSTETFVVTDVRPVFEEQAADYLYYKTDHHWTSLGAGLAAGVFSAGTGTSFDLSSYEPMLVTKNFKGTLAGKTGSIFLKDSIDIRVAKNNPDYVVFWADGSKTSSIYHMEALDARNQYEVFLGPNQSVVQIETTVDNDRHLLLFKDSYANAMIQYLLPQYQSLTIVDPRYYYDNVEQLLNLYNINEAAAVFSCDTLVKDKSLADVVTPYVQAHPVEETPEE